MSRKKIIDWEFRRIAYRKEIRYEFEIIICDGMYSVYARDMWSKSITINTGIGFTKSKKEAFTAYKKHINNAKNGVSPYLKRANYGIKEMKKEDW